MIKSTKINNITKSKTHCYDVTVANNHNFFCNGFLIHNCNYTGEIKIAFKNNNTETVLIESGGKYAQLVPIQTTNFTIMVADTLVATDRGDKGFGSSN